jgi:cytochrome c
MAGRQPGYLYSDAMRRSRVRWSTVELDRFLTAPGTALPGTRMFFAGMKNSEQRRALINFLQNCPRGK